MPSCRKCVRPAEEDAATLAENGYVGYKCLDCGLIYVAPRPDPDSISNLYDHDGAQVPAARLIASSGTFGKALKARHTLRFIRRHVAGGDLLEIGGGGGAFAFQARKYFRVHAAEFNPAQVAHMRKMGVDCRRGAFNGLFRGEKFDVIYHCDVLSHLSDPVADFRAMHDMLGPGGVLAFETGNNGDVRENFYPLVDAWMYPDHLFFFSQRSLANLAAASGFEPLEVHSYSRALEMRAMKPLRALRHGAGEGRGLGAEVHVGWQRRMLLNAKHLLDFSLIYAAGSIAPKRGRPQSIISVWRPIPTGTRVPGPDHNPSMASI
jgi:2-polyprenyl-3-methyl-5-hydroxy-6-metoxy-1,4-benzoquinol methylase